MRTINVTVAACALGLATACSGASSAFTSAPATSGDVVQYQQVALQVQSASGAYGQTMASGVSTVAECQALESWYDGEVRPWVSQMLQTSGAMDRLVSAHDGSADMGCGADAMMRELDSHRAGACASAVLAVDRAEAARHVQAMLGYTSHATERCGEMLSGLDTGDWSFGPMMSGCPGGGMMASGGMMGSH